MKVTRRTRTILIIAGTLYALVAISIGTMVWKCGMLVVRVHERSRDGVNLTLRLPGALVPAAMWVLPDRVFAEAARNSSQWAPTARSAMRAMAKAQDFVMVQVESSDETVHIAKRGGHLVIDVDSDDEDVHLSVPIFVVTSVLKRLEEA
jgi:hypothetical protein